MTDTDLTHDGFLGGRVMAWQPRTGYRAATDPVFLAAACPVRSGQTVLELGGGVGVASLCLAARVKGIRITCVERQDLYADLAFRNTAGREDVFTVIKADIASLPSPLNQASFDHVITNPPYFGAGTGTQAADRGREAALREDTPLDIWVRVAGARLKQRGWLTMIHAAERLPDCLTALKGTFGSVSVRPLQSRSSRPAKRILLRARKGGRTPFQLFPPLLIHEGNQHLKDGDDYTPTVRAILRDGAAISWEP